MWNFQVILKGPIQLQWMMWHFSRFFFSPYCGVHVKVSLRKVIKETATVMFFDKNSSNILAKMFVNTSYCLAPNEEFVKMPTVLTKFSELKIFRSETSYYHNK